MDDHKYTTFIDSKTITTTAIQEAEMEKRDHSYLGGAKILTKIEVLPSFVPQTLKSIRSSMKSKEGDMSDAGFEFELDF